MNPRERFYLSLALLIGAPFVAWLTMVRFTVGWPDVHRARWLFEVARVTPYHWPLVAAIVVALIPAIAVLVAVSFYGRSPFQGAPFSKFLRGTAITTSGALARLTRDRDGRAQVTIAGVPVPIEVEDKHFLFVGTTGSGKSSGMTEIAHGALLRNEKMITLDPGGELMAKLGMDGDILLNPYDARSVGWAFPNEIRNPDVDFDRYARSIIPVAADSVSEEWASRARLLFSDTARKLYLNGDLTIEKLFHWTTIEDAAVLQSFLKGTMAESLFVNGPDSRALGSVRFTVSDKLAPHLRMKAGDFSLRDWLDDQKAKRLWITWLPDQAESLRPLVSAWTDTLFVSILSMPNDSTRRVWINLDELGNLDRLMTLAPAVTMGRKKGARVVAGLQSSSQLDLIYGKDEARTIRANFGTLVVLNIPNADPITANDFSEALGEHEVERRRETTNSPRGSSSAVTHERERVVTPSELHALPNLTGYLSISGKYPIAQFTTEYQPYKKRLAGFIPKESEIFGDAL